MLIAMASCTSLCRSSSNFFRVLYSLVLSRFPSLLYIGSGEGDLYVKDICIFSSITINMYSQTLLL